MSSPIGPSSDDFMDWLETRPDIGLRLNGKSKPITSLSAYEIWRNAWIKCQEEHGIITPTTSHSPVG